VVTDHGRQGMTMNIKSDAAHQAQPMQRIVDNLILLLTTITPDECLKINRVAKVCPAVIDQPLIQKQGMSTAGKQSNDSGVALRSGPMGGTEQSIDSATGRRSRDSRSICRNPGSFRAVSE